MIQKFKKYIDLILFDLKQIKHAKIWSSRLLQVRVPCVLIELHMVISTPSKDPKKRATIVWVKDVIAQVIVCYWTSVLTPWDKTDQTGVFHQINHLKVLHFTLTIITLSSFALL